MNIIDIQDSLKDFSENQLIKEMQMPSGNAPQFLVLSEIQRRKRVRDDFSKRQAAAEPTVAQEAIAASGVPVGGIAGMSEAMAPQSAASEGIGTIMPQAMRPQAPMAAPVPDDVAMGMRSGGIMSYDEGGVINANTGQFFPSSPRSYGYYSNESSLGTNVVNRKGDGVGPFQVKGSTAIKPGNQIMSLFPELKQAVIDGTYKDAEEAYMANKDMVDSVLMDASKTEPFVLDYDAKAMEKFDDPNRAAAAFNLGFSGAENYEDNIADFDYVKKFNEAMGNYSPQSNLPSEIANQDLSQGPDIASSFMGANAATTDAIDPQLIDGGRLSPADRAAQNQKNFRAKFLEKESGNQKTGADMPAGELSEIPPDAGFFATDQEENRIREEQLNKATTADPDFEVMPVVAEVKNDLANAGIGSTSAVNAAKEAKAAKTADQPKPPESNVVLRNTGDSDGAISLVDEIKALQAKMDKNRESDKWLALAQAGMALMSSKEPTLLGAAGEAGIAGLSAMKEANQRYEEGVVDLINARAKIAGKTDKGALTASNAITRLGQLQKALSGADGAMMTDAEKAEARNEVLILKRFLQERGGLPVYAAMTPEVPAA